ncbi:MAG: TcfC E-set like domain-containing protein [Gammaproteobacteria bacterium]|nr:TcfC E-set like domain-containing protein [Gammaproteobacteria bacterium]
MNRKLIYLAVIAGLSTLSRVALAATPSAAPAQFTVQGGPPPGFEDAELNTTQSNYISVYYAGNFIGNVMGSYDLNTVTLQNIAELVSKIPGIMDQKAVVAALSGKLPDNASHLCTGNVDNTKPYCSIISPPIAGIIFDADNYRATIFVNPAYLNLDTIAGGNAQPTLPDSTSGLSYFSNNNFSIAASQGTNTYSLNNLSIVAAGDNALNVTSNLTQTDTSANGASPAQAITAYSLQTANLTRFSNGEYYQLGMFTPTTGGFIGSPPVAGLSIQNYGILPTEAQGSPVEVFLPLPSQVSVYKNGYLISSQSFSAGKHLLDTSSFPNGSYDISLKIINNIGQSTTQTQFFVKQSALPPQGAPNYQVSLGFLQTTASSNFSSNSVTLPSFELEPVFTYSEVRKIAMDFGLQSAISSNFNRAYLTEAISYYGMSWQVSPGVLASNNKQYGWLLNAFFTPVFFPNFNFNSNNQKIYNSSTDTNASATQTGSGFSPVSATSFQSNNTANLQIGQTSNLSASLQYNQPQGAATQMQYGLSWTQTLFSSPLMTWQLVSSVTDTQGTPATLSVALSASFNTVYNIGITTGAGYSNANTISNTDGSSYNVYKPNYSLGLSKTAVWGANNQNNLSMSASTSQAYSNTSNTVSANYLSDLFTGNFNFSNTISKQFTNNSGNITSNATTVNQFAGTFQSNLAFVNGHFSGGYQQGNQAGVMVNVTAPTPTKIDVFINNQKQGQIKTGSPEAFFVPSYGTYNVTIQPAGIGEYGFDDRPKQVTLYAGNIQYLQWTLVKEYVVFAQIVDQKGQPLSNLLMLGKNPSDFNVTDGNGYIQANIQSDQTNMKFKSESGQNCLVTLKPSEIAHDDKNDLVVLTHPLTCIPD